MNFELSTFLDERFVLLDAIGLRIRPTGAGKNH